MAKKNRRAAKARRALLTLSLVLVVAFAAVGGTLAWLTDKSDVVTNTFNPTKIDVSLVETEGAAENYQFDIIPGKAITKDPKVTLSADSEASYVFVKIDELNNYATYFGEDSYTVISTWQDVPNNSGVYYQTVAANTGLANAQILVDNKVTPLDTLTQADMQTLAAAANKPQLVFTAYAIQKDMFESAEAAWNAVKDTTEQYYTQPGTTGN